mmetsp:Transcript_15536/g.47217  ORF Transcript_15536/g.47217 Transcript_15536/m.47217 type:complete len:202 (-) Transcript_15536:763-1368(-)|eukprot:scaffold89045_cov32-Tisochrysis_lutea.AAC.2
MPAGITKDGRSAWRAIMSEIQASSPKLTSSRSALPSLPACQPVTSHFPPTRSAPAFPASTSPSSSRSRKGIHSVRMNQAPLNESTCVRRLGRSPSFPNGSETDPVPATRCHASAPAASADVAMPTWSLAEGVTPGARPVALCGRCGDEAICTGPSAEEFEEKKERHPATPSSPIPLGTADVKIIVRTSLGPGVTDGSSSIT